jgi:hypothetical protein
MIVVGSELRSRRIVVAGGVAVPLLSQERVSSLLAHNQGNVSANNTLYLGQKCIVLLEWRYLPEPLPAGSLRAHAAPSGALAALLATLVAPDCLLLPSRLIARLFTQRRHQERALPVELPEDHLELLKGNGRLFTKRELVRNNTSRRAPQQHVAMCHAAFQHRICWPAFCSW